MFGCLTQEAQDLSLLTVIIFEQNSRSTILTRRNPPIQVQAQNSNCVLPEPSKSSEVIFLTGHGVTALSTVSVSGAGQETAAATIEIAEGTTPLYMTTGPWPKNLEICGRN